MPSPLKLYDLAASPNNVKVRLALAFKKIPYERVAVDPQDRQMLIQVSGQPLAPVLVHGDTVLFDSSAILRYLDANFRSGPRLFSPERERMKQIEDWEMFSRTQASEPVGLVFRQLRADPRDEASLRRANDLINKAAARVEEALAKTPYLMGDAPNAADFSVAPFLNLAALSAEAETKAPFLALFRKSLDLKGAPRTRDWIARVMALDR